MNSLINSNLPNHIWLSRFAAISLLGLVLLISSYFMLRNIEVRSWFSIKKIDPYKKDTRTHSIGNTDNELQ